MPTVGRSGPYRLFFFSNEGTEPMHVHVERDDCHAKFWVQPVELARFHRFGHRELRVIGHLVLREEVRIAQAWRRHFG